jgi:hypothetical protein
VSYENIAKSIAPCRPSFSGSEKSRLPAFYCAISGVIPVPSPIVSAELDTLSKSGTVLGEMQNEEG